MSVTEKTNRVLKIILCAFVVIVVRVWHLEVIQREEKLKEAEQPKRRAIVQKADRGIICDRFGIPLAVNKICYNAAIYYNQISQVSALSWKDEPGGKKRTYPRREYITKLSQELSKILDLDPLRVEDLIHSKASLFPHVPFILKSGLTEEEHYRLALMEKEWLGIHAEIGSERFYPKKKVGGEVIGSMGSISSKEYLTIADEIRRLQTIVEGWEEGQVYELSFEDAAVRLQELREKAYTIQDLVGKSGIEAKFEEQLRGFYGKKIFEVDPKGKFLKEQSGGRDAIPGQQISLSVSIELQEFAEALLAENEVDREGRSLGYDPEAKERKVLKQPWVKGGSVVAMDPKTGEILAMASTPRFDPNDFIPSSNETIQAQKQRNVYRWLENERHVAAIWDGRVNLSRERYGATKGFYEDSRALSWELFLDLTLPQTSPLKALLLSLDVKTAIQIQEDFETLLYHYSVRDAAQLFDKLRSPIPEATQAQKRLDPYFVPLTSHGDRLLLIDLCRLAVNAPAFTDDVVKLLGSMKLDQYRLLNQAVCRLEEKLREKEQKAFCTTEFKLWREEHQKSYLAEMRGKEKEKKTSAKPYIDYLDHKQREALFTLFWNEKKLDALTAAVLEDKDFALLAKSPEHTRAILHTFRSFADLQRPLLGGYRRVRKQKSGDQTEKHLAASFYPTNGFGHSCSYAFQGVAPQGSIFKLVTAYAALSETNGENPLLIHDEHRRDPKSSAARSQIVATALGGMPYTRIYKGGRLPRSSSPHVGKIDCIGAIEQSSNPYFSILAGDILKDPEDLNDAARFFGFGSQTGIGLPGEARGTLPEDLTENRTGLYSAAIGQHKLLVTPLQTAVMVSTIANGGKVLKPLLTKTIEGSLPNREVLNAFEQNAQEELCYLGISFPLFTSAIPRTESHLLNSPEREIVRSFEIPRPIRNQLLEGMDRVLWGTKGNSRPSIIRGLRAKPNLMKDFLSLQHQMVGKSGTAEVLFNPNITPSSPPYMYKHIWFAAISFPSQTARFEDPELVVVVNLRFGDAGKEAAPLAAQMIKKWRELKTRL